MPNWDPNAIVNGFTVCDPYTDREGVAPIQSVRAKRRTSPTEEYAFKSS